MRRPKTGAHREPSMNAPFRQHCRNETDTPQEHLRETRRHQMKRLLIVGLTGCTIVLAPTMSASAMPAATPSALGATDEAVIQVKGGHGHGHGHGHGWGHHGGRGHHY